MHGVLSIPNTANLLAACWHHAEQALQDQVQKYSPGLDEENITVSFHAKFAESLFNASDEKRIEAAFIQDFELSFWNVDADIRPEQIARGLRATVTLHKRATEKLTGGDFGLVILRPQIHHHYSSLHITEYGRGLLTQAKLKHRKGSPSFTHMQEKTLPDRLSYLALLLYQYRDDAMRDLRPFAWKIASGMTFDSLKALLKEDELRDSLTSRDIIRQLSMAKIGTDSASIISQFVAPDSNQALVIEINWPPGKHPGSRIEVHHRYQSEKVQQVLLRR
jgi:hypothetical protein